MNVDKNQYLVGSNGTSHPGFGINIQDKSPFYMFKFYSLSPHQEVAAGPMTKV